MEKPIITQNGIEAAISAWIIERGREATEQNEEESKKTISGVYKTDFIDKFGGAKQNKEDDRRIHGIDNIEIEGIEVKTENVEDKQETYNEAQGTEHDSKEKENEENER